MKVFNLKNSMQMPQGLEKKLIRYRQMRGFDARTWVEAKCHVLNSYMRKSHLDAAVVAVSGGVDSALVLALVKHASLQENSPIKKIVPISLPALDNAGATGQENALQKAHELCLALELSLLSMDISAIQKDIISQSELQLGLKADNWARGQSVAYTRTPILYSITSILSSNGFSAIICGTTNRDEGAYLGYVGKASDGMVDVQLISDLHKSEVYKSARYLRIPESILGAVCTGDMYDGRSDVEVFGASYDFVELYLSWINEVCLPLNGSEKMNDLASQDEKINKINMDADMDFDSKEAFKMYATNLENLHAYNAHKYLAGSPAVHLDILESNVVGGWQIQKDWLKSISENTERTLELEPFCVEGLVAGHYQKKIITNDITVVENIFTSPTLASLLKEIGKKESYSISSSGSKLQRTHKDDNAPKSRRFNIYHKSIAEFLWNIFKNVLPPVEKWDDLSYCEVDALSYYRPVGINPYIKINRYHEGGYLIPHYDGAYSYDSKHKNMKTVIIYLEDNEAKTRILDDKQENIPYRQRNLEDWPECKRAESLFEYPSKKNTALIFNNKMLHDATALLSGTKTILLTEVVYEKL